MPVFFSDEELAVVEAACARLIPTDEDPGATEAGVAHYIDGFLGAFSFDPPRIWAGGAFSGRFGGSAGFASFHHDFTAVDGEEQDRRLRDHATFTRLLYEHACEGMYGAPEYGGNRDLVGWSYIGFDGDVQPRGYTDEEVSGP